MKKYVAIALFEDMKDNNYRYEPGMIYPRPDLEVSENRINALLKGENVRGIKLIAELKGLDETEEVEESTEEVEAIEEVEETPKKRGKKKVSE